MAIRRPKRRVHIERHKDGTIWAKGSMVGEVPDGYWEWFRKDGTRLRSGSFESGEQVGEWTTYDQAGQVYKVTTMGKKVGRTNVPRQRTRSGV